MSRPILLINGPNLNLLGTREPHIYGHETLSDVITLAKQNADKLNVKLFDFQSNHEGAIVDRIQQAREEGVKGIIINPGQLYPGARIWFSSTYRCLHPHLGRYPRRSLGSQHSFHRASCYQRTCS